MPILTIGSKRILYIHVPKTGGTSVEDLLRSYGGSLTLYSPRGGGLPCPPQHFHGEILRELLGIGNTVGIRADAHDFDFVFMTVRHPPSRLLSEYRYARSNSQNWQYAGDVTGLQRIANPSLARMINFDPWIRYALLRAQRDPFFGRNHLRPATDFSVWNATVYRLEDGLESIRQHLDALIGTRGVLPAVAQKASTDPTGSIGELRAGTRRLIRSHFARDFAEYGYEFDIGRPVPSSG